MITERDIITLADNMAAAAADLNTMSYDQLITNRNQLIEQVHELFGRDRESLYNPMEWADTPPGFIKKAA